MRIHLLLFGLIFIVSGIGSAQSKQGFSSTPHVQKDHLIMKKENTKRDSISSGKTISDMKEIGESKMDSPLYQHMYHENLPQLKK